MRTASSNPIRFLLHRFVLLNPFVVSLSNHALGANAKAGGVETKRERRGSTGSPRTDFIFQ